MSELSPATLWFRLDPDTRLLAARSFFRHKWDDPNARREGEIALAQALRFREEAVRKLPVDKRAGYLATAVRPGDSLAGSLLLALHVENRRPMLTAFLDALGIPHADGLIDAGQEPAPPSADALSAAADALRTQFPPAEVEVYLATLYAIDPETWAGLKDQVG